MGYVYVDESGDTGLGIRSKRYLIYGFIYCKDPSFLSQVLRNYLRIVTSKNEYPPKLLELKFAFSKQKLLKLGYSHVEISDYLKNQTEIRKNVFRFINLLSDGIIASILDKETVNEPTWTPITICNFVFAETLQKRILQTLAIDEPNILYDQGRIDKLRETEFNRYNLNILVE